MRPMQAKMQPTISIVGVKRNPQAVKPFKRFIFHHFFSPMNKFMGYWSRSVAEYVNKSMGCCIGEQNEL